jgi:hypothetical protein
VAVFATAAVGGGAGPRARRDGEVCRALDTRLGPRVDCKFGAGVLSNIIDPGDEYISALDWFSSLLRAPRRGVRGPSLKTC